MSGEITIIPGKTLAVGEKVNRSKLNQIAAPTARLNAASVGQRELISAELLALIQNYLTVKNWLVNGNFLWSQWQSGGPVSCPVGVKTSLANYWNVRPAGAAVSQLRDTAVPNSTSLHSLSVIGAVSTTTVDILQEIKRDFALGLRQTLTLSFYLYNNTGSAFQPRLQINAANAVDDFSATTNVLDVALASCPNATWTKVTYPFDASAMANFANGVELVIRIPSGSMNQISKSVNISQAKLELGSTATPFISANDSLALLASIALLDDSVTNSILANMASGTLKGRFTAGSGNPEDITLTALRDALDQARVDVASGATTDIGAVDSHYVRITGTTTITSLGTAAAGIRRLVVFSGVLTLTHNATSLILPTGASIATEVGDTARFVSEGSGNWRCESYQRASGVALSAVTSGVQMFNASTTWIVPTGKTSCFVQARGASGGGARNSGGNGAAGGGGAGYSERLITGLTPGASIVVTIGAAGVGRTGSNGAGTAGGTTSFGSNISITGGGGGAAGSGGAGGTGGVASSGDTNLTGGAGANGDGITSPNNGSGGGGAASLYGRNGTVGTVGGNVTGTGGLGGGGTGATASAAAQSGVGGGGGAGGAGTGANLNGADGCPGQIIVWY